MLNSLFADQGRLDVGVYDFIPYLETKIFTY
jgi:hypothetical protein